MTRSILATFVALVALTGSGWDARAGGTPQQKCQSAKLKAAGKGISGEMGCHAKGKAKAPFNTDPGCITKVQSKTAAAVSKAGGACDGTASSVQSDITTCVNNLLPDVPGTDKCPSASTEAVGKGGGALLACESKEVTKPGSYAACDTKADGKTQAGVTKVGSCGQSPFATIHTHLHDCDAAIKNGMIPPPTTTSTTSISITTTNSRSTTSTTTAGSCAAAANPSCSSTRPSQVP